MKRKDEDDNIDHNNNKKKGVKWTEEDQKLIDTIKIHGKGKKQHCGKMSCRIRWMKNLRRRHFSEAEEDLIIKLHALLGDRWSLIAGRLPGRTDYEIENYWNSHMKEKLKSAGIDPNNHRVEQTLITTSSSTTTTTKNPKTYEDTKSFISRKEPSRNLFEPRSSTRNGDEEEKEVAGFSSTELNLDLTIAFRHSSSSSSPSCFLRLEKKKQLEEDNDELLTDIIDTQNQQQKPTLLLFK